jgi:DNA modification methylase
VLLGRLAPDNGDEPGPEAPAREPKPPWRNRIVGHADEPPEALLPNPLNWRTHPRAQLQALDGVLAEIGWVDEILVNRKTGHVVNGHARIALAIERHEATVPVTFVELSADEERLVLATFDPLGSMATTNLAQLEELLAAATPSDERVATMLGDLAARNGLASLGLGDPDAVLEPPDPTALYVHPGERWRLGDHVLLVGDATNPADVARLLGSAEPRLLVTDPPYGIRLDLTWRDKAAGRERREGHGRASDHATTSLTGDDRVDWSAAFELVPSLRVAYVWHAAIHAPEVAAGLTRIGFEIVGQIIWDKGLFVLSRGWYSWIHEPCWVGRKPGQAVPFLGPRNQSTIWRAPSPKRVPGPDDDGQFDRPTQKPVMLAETPIRNHLKLGEAAYDPFVGSGTSLVAAERVGRSCFAMEIKPAFAQLALERWQAFTGRTAVRDD